ncbi:MAG: hypothetical protein A2W18_13495 [Candidatus Muproteobacteria bacterium RBG_16_60_9]|uniref:Big-1 domain-containing protein n=1 Tax=Candidatus Muproteobacteria bacterium RBG_16_60_9 TaxID=1817755 RepID=A0A1F6V8P4_9PROT|nr:MAG: hypothetical protein A2W18_13495 [Candidatus Muproteobacteria bacterium RBG_16_60_9]
MKMWMNRYAVVLFAVALVAGCGSDKGSGVGPTASTIQILPTATDFLPYLGNAIPAFRGPRFVTVTVFNSSGNPVRGASVTMFNAGRADFMQSSDSVGSFGTFQPDPYVATTDDFGNVYLYIFAPGHSFVGARVYDFEAFSGSARAEMPVSVTCTDTNTATTLVCD